MQLYYGDKNLLRALDEAEFWKRQEKEHTIVIRNILPDLEAKYVDKLKKWEKMFTETYCDIKKMIDSINPSNYTNPLINQKIINTVGFAVNQSKQFVNFLNDMKSQSSVVRNNNFAITVINHIIRESVYFIDIVKSIMRF